MAVARTRCVRWLIGVFTFVLLGWIAPGSAQAQVNTGKVSFNTGIDMSHAYFFRGIRQEDEGFVAQPYADINFNVWSDDDAAGLTGVDFTLGIWNSLHSGPTGSDAPGDGNVKMWYEYDFFTGFTLNIDNYEAGIIFTSYTSPNQSFSTTQELALSLGMDDSELLGAFSMNPSVLIAIETKGGADGGSSEGVYLQLGVEPGMPIGEDVASISFPITIGLSLSNYYESGGPILGPEFMPLPGTPDDGFNDSFGFFSIGAAAAFPLPVSENYGAWELTGSLQFLALGSYLEFLNQGDGGQVIGAFGVSIGY